MERERDLVGDALTGIVGKLRRGWRWFRDSLVYRILARQRRWLVALVLLALLNTLVTLGVVVTIRKIVDEAVIDGTTPLRPLVGRLIVLAAIGTVVGFAQRQTAARIGFQLEYELRVLLYRTLLSADPRRLDSLATGQMVTRAQTDLQLLELLILLIPVVGAASTLLLGVGIAMFVLSPVLAPVALLAIPVNLYLVMRIRRRLWGLSWVALHRRAAVTTAIDEAVRGIRVVKAFGTEEQERTRVKDAAARAFGVAMTRVRLLARFNLLLQAFPVVLNAALLAAGAYLAVNGYLTVGTLLVFLIFARVFVSFARSFDEIVSVWQFAKTGAGRIFELLELAPAASEETGEPLPPHGTGLTIENAKASFDGRRILDGFDLDVGPGELVVVAGPPGSGKTTVASLATGLRRPDGGRILLDGGDLQRLDPAAVRTEIRMLDEEPFLFSRTLRENLEMGVPDETSVDEDTLRAALETAGIDGLLEELPHGLDTILGDRGLTLSGGQRQRLALARTLVAPPRVLVSDDGLSAVNPSLETDILERIHRHAPDTAVLWITRRDTAHEVADRAVVLPDPPDAQPSSQPIGNDMGEQPYTPELADIIAELPPDTDRPEVTEEDATESDRVPTVPNVLEPLKKRVLQTTLILLAFTVVGLAPEGLMRIAVDAVESGNGEPAYWVALAIAALAGAIAVSVYFFQIFAKRIDEGIMYLLRRRTFQRLSRLGIDFYDRELPGRVATRVVHDLDRISAFLDNGIYQLAVSFALLAGAFGVIWVWSPPVGAAVSIFVPILLVVTLVQVPLAARAYRWARREMGVVIARLQEDYAGRHVIAGLGVRGRARRGFAESAWELRRARRWSTVLTNAYIEIIQGITGVAMAVLIWRAGNLAIAGTLSLGSMIALQLYLRSGLAPIPMLSGVLQRYLAAKASFRTLAEPYRAPIRPRQQPDARRCRGLSGAISFTSVTFRYPGTEREVLHDLDLHVRPGETVALVGPTGAGKSSIAKLLARAYDPDRGAVKVDGYTVRSFDYESYRHHIGVVPQESFLFRGTVASNIAYGRPDATREQIERAVDESAARTILERLPGGLNTPVDEEGRNLTAAQRQVVALARAWLVNPDILALDEATSNLDEETERAVLDAAGIPLRTTILITHRPQVAERAERVLVVEDGRIVASGTHGELLSREGPYRRLWQVSPGTEQAPASARTGAPGPPTAV